MEESRIQYLFERHIAGNATQAEEEELSLLALIPANADLIRELMEINWRRWEGTEGMDKEDAAMLINSILNNPIAEKESSLKAVNSKPAGVHSLRTGWFKYPTSLTLRWASAAAVILLFGVGAYLWNTQKKEERTAQVYPAPGHDVAPGSNKAILTLADGSAIILDSASNGKLASEGGAIISKSANGEIVYKKDGSETSASMVFNTMQTPRGGQYQLTLPDGSKVWLNASSSITYPTVFSGKERNVSIKGEAYFEVTKNSSKPFIVKTAKDQITVLGTSFNVNAYSDEPAIKTSLLEGAVLINNKVLKPGEAYMDGNIIKTDVHKDVAWKNGVFNFEDKKFDEVMRQLSRWYDIEIVYTNGIPEKEYGGELKRNLTLSQVLKIFENSDIRFQLEGRKLIVKP